MLALTEKVEANDFDGALDELDVRKTELVETHEYLTNLEGDEAPEENKTDASVEKKPDAPEENKTDASVEKKPDAPEEKKPDAPVEKKPDAPAKAVVYTKEQIEAAKAALATAKASIAKLHEAEA